MNPTLFGRSRLGLVAALLIGVLAGLALTWRARPAAADSRIAWPSRAELAR